MTSSMCPAGRLDKPRCYAMGLSPLTNARSQIGVLRFNGSHLGSTSFTITLTTASSSETAAAGTRRHLDDCGRPRCVPGEWIGPHALDLCDDSVGSPVARGRSPSLSTSSKTHVLFGLGVQRPRG